MHPLVRDLAETIADAGGIENAKAEVSEWSPAAAMTDVVARSISQPAIVADMAGQLMVHTHEMAGRHRLSRKPSQMYLFQSGRNVPAFLDLPWVEAIDQFKQLGPEHMIREREFVRWVQSYTDRGADATKLIVEQLRRKSFELLEQAYTEGWTQQYFVQNLTEFADALGVGPHDPHYLRNVFRTNTMTAYGAGKWRAISHPDVIEKRPYWQYKTVGKYEARVRPSHRVLHDLIFEVGNPETDTLVPPNGYQCRCSALSIERGRNVRVTNRVPDDGRPDPEFAQAPTALMDARIA